MPTFLPEKARYTALGMISGTSLDAIEVALVHFTGSGLNTGVEFVGHLGVGWPPALKGLLSAAAQGGLDMVTLSRLDKAAGEAFAAAVNLFMAEQKLHPADIDFIASHGQTVGHWPAPAAAGEYAVASTCQLGDGAVIAARTGILTVCDFRSADMARGGQGAPLVPYFDYLLYRSTSRGRVLLNLGGIANITVLPHACTLEQVFGFDTGPANALCDTLALRFSGGAKTHDEDGVMACAGRPLRALLDALLQHPYLKQKPPKSVDRAVFADILADYLINHRGAATDADLMATAADYTVETIALALDEFVLPEHLIEELIVSGGGIHNRAIMRGLEGRLGHISITPADSYGIPAQAKEAVAFAFLGHLCLSGLPGNLPAVTGAKSPAILGKICPV